MNPQKSSGFGPNPRAGFSLVEMLVVIAVIGTIAAIAVPSVGRINNNAKEAKSKRNAQNLASIAESASAAGHDFVKEAGIGNTRNPTEIRFVVDAITKGVVIDDSDSMFNGSRFSVPGMKYDEREEASRYLEIKSGVLTFTSEKGDNAADFAQKHKKAIWDSMTVKNEEGGNANGVGADVFDAPVASFEFDKTYENKAWYRDYQNGTATWTTKADNIDGWQTTATDQMFQVFTAGAENIASSSGNAYIELNAAERSTVYKEVDVSKIDELMISFAHAKRSRKSEQLALYIGHTKPEHNTARNKIVSLEGQGFQKLIITDTEDLKKWERYIESYEVPDGAESMYIAFESLGGHNVVGNLLDDVQVRAAAVRE